MRNSSTVSNSSKVLKACHKINEERLKSKANGKIKCARIFEETYGKKAYVSQSHIYKVRQMYKTRFGMHPFAGNFSKDFRFARTNWLCRCFEAIEDENHLLSGNCDIYGNIRAKYENLDDDENLVKFFNEILKKRDELEDKDNTIDNK